MQADALLVLDPSTEGLRTFGGIGVEEIALLVQADVIAWYANHLREVLEDLDRSLHHGHILRLAKLRPETFH